MPQVVHNICRLVLNTSKAHAPEILDIVYTRFGLATPQKVPESRMSVHRDPRNAPVTHWECDRRAQGVFEDLIAYSRPYSPTVALASLSLTMRRWCRKKPDPHREECHESSKAVSAVTPPDSLCIRLQRSQQPVSLRKKRRSEAKSDGEPWLTKSPSSI